MVITCVKRDCEQSLFALKSGGKSAKTERTGETTDIRGSLEGRVAKPQAASSADAGASTRGFAASQLALYRSLSLRSSPRILDQKRDYSQFSKTVSGMTLTGV